MRRDPDRADNRVGDPCAGAHAVGCERPQEERRHDDRAEDHEAVAADLGSFDREQRVGRQDRRTGKTGDDSEPLGQQSREQPDRDPR